jgi:COP9 signalosome complex subunit 2
LLNITKPYTRVTLQFLARELSLTTEEVESMLIELILNSKLNASINQIEGFLVMNDNTENAEQMKMKALCNYVKNLELISNGFSSNYT